jgi:hypothetical protein
MDNNYIVARWVALKCFPVDFASLFSPFLKLPGSITGMAPGFIFTLAGCCSSFYNTATFRAYGRPF